jgi:hypothetical protein
MNGKLARAFSLSLLLLTFLMARSAAAAEGVAVERSFSGLEAAAGWLTTLFGFFAPDETDLGAGPDPWGQTKQKDDLGWGLDPDGSTAPAREGADLGAGIDPWG